jgi:ketosteroid isomerase-like protein
MDNPQRDPIVAAVEARVRSFEAAERARDPELLIAHFASLPDFHFYHDGRLATHAAMAAGVRGALPRVRSLSVEYGDVQVLVLSAEYALVSATFRREMAIDDTGASTKSEGAVSWLWRSIDGQWFMVHGHISHPLGPAK